MVLGLGLSLPPSKKVTSNEVDGVFQLSDGTLFLLSDSSYWELTV